MAGPAPTRQSDRASETSLEVPGEEKYLSRAVDSTGQTIAFRLPAKRDAAAAQRFFRKVFR